MTQIVFLDPDVRGRQLVLLVPAKHHERALFRPRWTDSVRDPA